MKNETKTWLKYANENFESAKVLLENELYNPCLQNIQQSVLPDFEPDTKICQQGLDIAKRILSNSNNIIQNKII